VERPQRVRAMTNAVVARKARRGLGWPGFGESSPQPGRTVAGTAAHALTAAAMGAAMVFLVRYAYGRPSKPGRTRWQGRRRHDHRRADRRGSYVPNLAAILASTYDPSSYLTSQRSASAAPPFEPDWSARSRPAGIVWPRPGPTPRLAQARPGVAVMIGSGHFQLWPDNSPQFLVAKVPFARCRRQHQTSPGGTP
jgi:hypothetical protein